MKFPTYSKENVKFLKATYHPNEEVESNSTFDYVVPCEGWYVVPNAEGYGNSVVLLSPREGFSQVLAEDKNPKIVNSDRGNFIEIDFDFSEDFAKIDEKVNSKLTEFYETGTFSDGFRGTRLKSSVGNDQRWKLSFSNAIIYPSFLLAFTRVGEVENPFIRTPEISEIGKKYLETQIDSILNPFILNFDDFFIEKSIYGKKGRIYIDEPHKFYFAP